MSAIYASKKNNKSRFRLEIRNKIFEDVRKRRLFGTKCLWQFYMVRDFYATYPKELEEQLDMGNMSYEHYKSGNKRIMRLSTLFIMNKMMYSFSISSSYFTNSKVYAANYREKYITTKVYSSIKCDNDILKYILFAMIRVMNSHYLFEKKLAKWASINIPSFNCSKFENTLMIYNKLRYIESICPSLKRIDFVKFDDCFVKWRGLLNDFAHSASRMIPPYLTISPIEMSKLESCIKRLP